MLMISRLYIVLLLIVFSSCSTLKLSEILANGILDNINNGGYRYDYSSTNFISHVEKTEEDLTISDTYFNNIKEVRNMEQPEVITMITSIIAGLYAVIRTIIDLIKKFKK